MLVRFAQVGDGTTSVVLLAGEILKHVKGFVEDGLHPQVSPAQCFLFLAITSGTKMLPLLSRCKRVVQMSPLIVVLEVIASIILVPNTSRASGRTDCTHR